MKISTRQSKLALFQSELAKEYFKKENIEFTLLPMETRGDNPNYPFFTGKGVFVKELQERLLRGIADIAVHSLKDLPVVQAPHLALTALLPRASKEDVLVLSPQVQEESGLNQLSQYERDSLSFEELKEYLYKSNFFRTQKMGTSSLHRKVLFQKYFGMDTVSIRGNVGTRLNKVRNNEYSCTFLAKAGLERLNLFSLDNAEMFVLNPRVFIPSAGQGIIAVEACSKSKNFEKILQASSNITSIEACLEAGFERLVLWLLESDCYTPVGVYFQENILSVMLEKENQVFQWEIEISKAQIEDAYGLLKAHNNIFTSFFQQLCKSDVARYLRELLCCLSKFQE